MTKNYKTVNQVKHCPRKSWL